MSYQPHINAATDAVILVTAAGAIGEFDRAMELANVRPVERLVWTDIADSIPIYPRQSIFLLEASGVDEEDLAGTLPSIASAAETMGAPIVISVDPHHIDVAAAAVFGPRTQMLCSPTMIERVGAIITAVGLVDHSFYASDVLAEGEAARLQKLNDEVARIAGVLTQLTRQTQGGTTDPSPVVTDQRMTFGIQPITGITIDPSDVRRAIRARRMRDQFFGAGLFEEPGWDMLLDLFAAELEKTRVSVSSLCIAAAVAPTTALRWISKLTDAGLFERHPDPFDRRRAYMELSPRASEAVRTYVAALRRAGLSLG